MKNIDLTEFLQKYPPDYEIVLADWAEGFRECFILDKDEITVFEEDKEIILGLGDDCLDNG